MTIMSGLGIVLSLVFGCLLLALVAELYYLLWWKKQRIVSDTSNRVGEDFSSHAKEMFYLFCWDKPSTIINSLTSSNTTAANPETNHNDPDIEMGFDARKDLLLKALAEDGVDSDIMKLAGHPRFLFTINEETKEDLESDDGKSKGDKSRKGSRTRSLSDLIMAMETQTPYLSPMASPNHLKVNSKLSSNNYNNPLFESSVEAEIYRLRSSPPPKFKFLRDAEEKLYRKLVDEAQKSGMLNEVVLDNPPHEEEKDESLMEITDNNGVKNKEKDWEIHCSSQVLPLASSPNSDPFTISSVESKQPCLH